MDCQARKTTSRHGLYLAVACSLLGVTRGGSPYMKQSSMAFVTPRAEESPLQRERDSEVRLFTRGPESQLSAATLTYTGDFNPAYPSGDAVFDPFDPDFRPSGDGLWGPAPISVGTKAAALPLDTAHSGRFKVFCDLDGVLVDFEAGVRKVCRQGTAELAKTTMWRKIAQSKTAFFAELPWTKDGPQLWQAIRHLKPDILTGVPDLEDSRMEKFKWCRENLGMDDYRWVDMAGHGYVHDNVNGVSKACPERESHVTNVITCWSYNKHHESGQQAILIDDRIALKESWEAKGGIFVHHTDTQSTLRKLKELGVLDPKDVLLP